MTVFDGVGPALSHRGSSRSQRRAGSAASASHPRLSSSSRPAFATTARSRRSQMRSSRKTTPFPHRVESIMPSSPRTEERCGTGKQSGGEADVIRSGHVGTSVSAWRSDRRPGVLLTRASLPEQTRFWSQCAHRVRAARILSSSETTKAPHLQGLPEWAVLGSNQ
jgi:hypothetical protein